MRDISRGILWVVAAICLTAPAAAAPRIRTDLSEIMDWTGQEGPIADLLMHLVQDPNDAGAHINLGNLYAREQQFDLAERSYQRALKLDDSNPIAWNNLGVLYLRQGEIDEAEACFSEAITRDEKYAVARYNLASILDTRGRYDSALEQYRIAIGLRPELAVVRTNPYVVNNAHLVAASLLNYLNRETYSMLVEKASQRPSQRVLGIAVPQTRPLRKP